MRFMQFDSMQVFTNSERRSFFLHLIIAILCIPIYKSGLGTLFGLMIAPYIFFLVFSARNEYLLPLIAHTFWGSQQRYLMLFACLLYAFFRVDRLIVRKVLGLFVAYLLILPFFIWYTIKRYQLFGGGIGMGGTFNGLGYYLAFSPFFWAVAANVKITRETLIWSVYVGFGLLSVLVFGKSFCRACTWVLVFLPVLSYWLIGIARSNRGRGSAIVKLAVAGFVGSVLFLICFIGFGPISITFTQLGAVAIAIMYLFLAKKGPKIIRFVSPLLMFGFSCYMVFFAINNMQKNRGAYNTSGLSYEEVKIRDIDSFEEKMMRKMFNDRAPLWTAAWDAVCQQFEKNPIWVDIVPIYGTLAGGEHGERQVEITLMAHNIMLLLLQEYGLWGGAGLYLIYILLFAKKEVRLAMAMDRKSYYTPIAAACLGHAIMGGWAGQYIMNVEFSFLLYSMWGCVYIHYLDKKKERANANRMVYQYYPA